MIRLTTIHRLQQLHLWIRDAYRQTKFEGLFSGGWDRQKAEEEEGGNNGHGKMDINGQDQD